MFGAYRARVRWTTETSGRKYCVNHRDWFVYVWRWSSPRRCRSMGALCTVALLIISTAVYHNISIRHAGPGPRGRPWFPRCRRPPGGVNTRRLNLALSDPPLVALSSALVLCTRVHRPYAILYARLRDALFTLASRPCERVDSSTLYAWLYGYPLVD